MKNLVQLTIGILLFGLATLPIQAAFTSLYVFGDALSSTADGTTGPLYYPGRDSNGRVWVEVLAQRQGLIYDATKNVSYFDHDSATLVTDVNNFIAPPDVSSALFVVWVCNADTFDATTVLSGSKSNDTNKLLNIFIAANMQSQTNHLQIITNLYAKGVRTLIMPNAVDISEIPSYDNGNLTSVLRAGCIDYDARFSNNISQAIAMCPGLTIYTPDFYTLLNNVLTNAANYGLINAVTNYGKGNVSVDALTALYAKAPVVLNGAGTNYIFWDDQDPTAEFHEVIADVVQQIISPAQIGKLALLNGSNRLDVINYPAGLNGSVDGSTNLALGNWTSVTNIGSSNILQSFFVTAPLLPASTPASGDGGGGSIDPNNPGNQGGTYIAPNNPAQFYRLDFPYAWSWP
jgi:phospholipase/lecithinase/hemolysin